MKIRIETDGASDLSQTQSWLARHRGEVVRLDGTRSLVLGNPISGARSVLVAAVLQDDERPGPQLGGVVRALSNRISSEPVRLVFEGRSQAGVPQGDVETIASEMLADIAGLVVDEQPLAEVA